MIIPFNPMLSKVLALVLYEVSNLNDTDSIVRF